MLRRLLMAALAGGVITMPAMAQDTQTEPPGGQFGAPTPRAPEVTEPTNVEPDRIRDPAYDAALQSRLPLTDDMIEELARRLDVQARGRARIVGPSQVAVPVQRSLNASLEPGGATSIIQTVRGYPTALAFVDSTGEPWPIAWNTNSNPVSGNRGGGNNGQAAVQADGFDVNVPTKGSNVIQISARSDYPRGGLLVNLEGAPVPLTFMLVAGKDRYDARVDVRVSQRGPNAKVQIITRPNTPETGAAYLTSMLDGVPPAEAVPLDVTGVSPQDVRAWRMGGNVYLRTRYTLLAPEWTAAESGEAGTTIYAMPDTPVVLLSADGRSISARLAE